MKLVFALLLLANALLGADATGKWAGHILIERDGGTIERTPWIIVLRVQGDSVSGTAGPSETDQKPITASEIPRDWLVFAVNSQLRIDLRVEGDKATGYIAQEGQTWKRKLELRRQ